MICKYCGTLVSDEMKFCTNCGKKMERKTNKKSSALPVIILLAVIIAAGVAAFFLLRGEKFLGGRKDITITEAVTTNTNGI